MRSITTNLSAAAFNNADNGTEFTTCVGRIVWGHPLKPQHKTKDDVKVLDQNGQPINQWSFGVAFAKADFQQHIWPHLAAETAKGYPNGAPPNFTYKYKDGDTDVDGKGNPLSGKEGYAGCYILSFSTELQAPNCFVSQNGAYMQIGVDQIKTGDFVMVGTNAKWHAQNPNARGSRPGLYINPLLVLLCYEGDAISGSYTADPNALFGAAPAMGQMPAGARPIGAPAPGGAMPSPGAGMPGNSLPPATMPGAQSALPAAPVFPAAATTPPAPPAPSGPQRPADPSHIHDNGNGTEQWFVNGAWDGGAHPVPTAAPLPPPATGFVAQAGAMPGMPAPR